jgi:hypothetical protein
MAGKFCQMGAIKLLTVYIIKKAVKRLYLLKVLKSYNAPMEDLKAFYTGVIRSVLEYRAQIWNGNLTFEQSNDIERLQKRALGIILPAGMSYDHALRQSNLKTLKEGRYVMCVDMIKKMSNPGHKFHHLLPMKVSQLRERERRTNGLEYYNYAYAFRTKRFSQSPIIYAILQYISTI